MIQDKDHEMIVVKSYQAIEGKKVRIPGFYPVDEDNLDEPSFLSTLYGEYIGQGVANKPLLVKDGQLMISITVWYIRDIRSNLLVLLDPADYKKYPLGIQVEGNWQS